MSLNHSDTAHEAPIVKEPARGLKFMVPLFLGILVVAFCIYIFKGCSGQPKVTVSKAETTQ